MAHCLMSVGVSGFALCAVYILRGEIVALKRFQNDIGLFSTLERVASNHSPRNVRPSRNLRRPMAQVGRRVARWTVVQCTLVVENKPA